MLVSRAPQPDPPAVAAFVHSSTVACAIPWDASTAQQVDSAEQSAVSPAPPAPVPPAPVPPAPDPPAPVNEQYPSPMISVSWDVQPEPPATTAFAHSVTADIAAPCAESVAQQAESVVHAVLLPPPPPSVPPLGDSGVALELHAAAATAAVKTTEMAMKERLDFIGVHLSRRFDWVNVHAR